MKHWWDRIRHEPPDPDIGRIRKDLKTEEQRHSAKVADINEALSDLQRTRKIADREMQS